MLAEIAEVESIKTAVSNRSWWHRIDIGSGIVTPGADDSRLKWDALHLPEDMSRISVLDVGAWDGFFSFECEHRGAAVLATDHHCWTGSGIKDKGGFDIAKSALRSKIGEKIVRVEDISQAEVGTFDIVLFLGVLYHSPDPLGYLRIVRSVTKGLAVIETVVDLLEVARPALAYYPGDALANDPTNFFGPNELAVHGMCKDAGFSRVETIKPAWAPGRMVFHAFA